LYYQCFVGALGGIRTPDPQIRSLVLYPAELRAHEAFGRENSNSNQARHHRKVPSCHQMEKPG
jgi:hypothetical protein